MCSLYELIEELPEILGRALTNAQEHLAEALPPTPEQSRDLANYRVALEAMQMKVTRLTDAVLSKPALAVFLRTTRVKKP
jgi:hypothetical protein